MGKFFSFVVVVLVAAYLIGTHTTQRPATKPPESIVEKMWDRETGQLKPERLTKQERVDAGLTVMGRYAVAELIAERCRGFEMASAFQLLREGFSKLNDANRRYMTAVKTTIETKYDYARGTTAFCQRILAVHGPSSGDPLVRKTAAARK